MAIFMAMGAMRMSRNRVLTRRAAAIETLGAATTLTQLPGLVVTGALLVAALALLMFLKQKKDGTVKAKLYEEAYQKRPPGELVVSTAKGLK